MHVAHGRTRGAAFVPDLIHAHRLRDYIEGMFCCVFGSGNILTGWHGGLSQGNVGYIMALVPQLGDRCKKKKTPPKTNAANKVLI